MKALNLNVVQSWRFGELARFRLKQRKWLDRFWGNRLWLLWRRLDRLERDRSRSRLESGRSLESLKASNVSLDKLA